ncbi:chromatin target of PRMT1 protein-like [Periophthalmus magnuspinnatus]|uniref:chromatin target of PRMT1 protein-like n=1 Tax=Periophthalmus magnuspinnatus TaxID=409849 RepID=UPI0024369180|nr:chromatin target of PRMT1 protein-like [Periophthalmus magnuspinnatus]
MEKKPDLLYLEQKTTQSLHNRFSEILLEQMTQRKVLFKGNKKLMVLRLRNSPRSQGASPKGSVWTRIGWKGPWRRGVWNFRNKYQRAVRFSPAHKTSISPILRSRFSAAPSSCFVSAPKSRFSLGPKRGTVREVLKRRLQGHTCLFKGKSVQSRLGVGPKGRDQLGAGSEGCGLSVGVPLKRHGLQKKAVPSKKQLDSQLDRYMSKTKSRLDADLDRYMSLSRNRLDAQLDEYMAMAGDSALWQ